MDRPSGRTIQPRRPRIRGERMAGDPPLDPSGGRPAAEGADFYQSVRSQPPVVESQRMAGQPASIQRLTNVLRDYPEVEQLLRAQPMPGKPRSVGRQGFEPYMPFADTEQQLSMPEARARLYNQAIQSAPDPDVRRVIMDTLINAEEGYTSGDPAMQRDARRQIEAITGAGSLAELETSAFRPRRPVVGGGGYLPLVYGLDVPLAGTPLTEGRPSTVAETLEYIDRRAHRVNQALARAQQAEGLSGVASFYPGSASVPVEPFARAFTLDPASGLAVPASLSDRDAYRLVGAESEGGSFRLEDSTIAGNSDISANALRFLRDNPVGRVDGMEFRVATPGEIRGTYTAREQLPPAISARFESAIREALAERALPGTLFEVQPMGSRDLIAARNDPDRSQLDSSMIRRLQPFVKAPGAQLPNLRGLAYSTAGFGPVNFDRAQYSYADTRGNLIPIQFHSPESPLVGSLRWSYADPRFSVAQPSLPASSTPRYYSTDPVSAAGRGLLNLGGALRGTPSALLPGVSDLIPSPEAIQTGYREGLVPMAGQMASDFVQGIPSSLAAAGVLATPAAAPLAPGIGAGMLGVAGARAVNEVVRQQTGEGIVPKLRQAIGTEPRTGAADRPRQPDATPRSTETPRIIPTQQVNPIMREIQNRFGLARERFNPARGEFGLSELLFGR